MVKLQLMIVVLALSLCTTTAEARGRRMAQQQAYTPYYNYTVPMNSVAVPSNVVVPANTVAAPANGVVQTNAVATPSNGVVQANAVVTSSTSAASVKPVVAAVGSAQWKAEQSARLCSVQHIGGGFGGGSFEGNGFGATPEQAIQGSCYWGQRTPIEIGVARGANGYYATVFYR